MAAAEEDEVLPPRLPELFGTRKQLLDQVEVAAEATGSRRIQKTVAKGLPSAGRLPKCYRSSACSAARRFGRDCFHRPEGPGGASTSRSGHHKAGQPQRASRSPQGAREQFLNYFTQCQHCRVAEFELSQNKNESAERNTALPPRRVRASLLRCLQGRLERGHRQRMEAEQRLSALKSAVEGGAADDERVREFCLLALQRWVCVGAEEIASLDQAIKIRTEKDSSTEASTTCHSFLQDRPPMKPFILTQNAAQGQVFGAGSPGLACEVNEWCDQCQNWEPYQVREQPRQGPRSKSSSAGGSGTKGSRGAEQTLQQAQEWGAWKDTHPRGCHSRQSMG